MPDLHLTAVGIPGLIVTRWTVVAPNNVTLSGNDSQINIAIDYNSQLGGDVRIQFISEFAQPGSPTPTGVYPGLEIPTVLSIKDGLSGRTILGFDIILKNFGPAPQDFIGHPNDYAHFHNIKSDGLPGSTITLHAPNGQLGALNGSSVFTPAGNWLDTGSSIRPGVTKTIVGSGPNGTITIGSDNTPGPHGGSFELILHPHSLTADPQATVRPSIGEVFPPLIPLI